MSEFRILDELVGGLSGAFVDILSSKITQSDRVAMAQAIKDWLLTKARTKPLPDLEDRRSRMFTRIDEMVKSVTFSKVGDNFVVKATGEGEVTLKKLQNGTEWFDPCESVVTVMISALWKS